MFFLFLIIASVASSVERDNSQEKSIDLDQISADEEISSINKFKSLNEGMVSGYAREVKRSIFTWPVKEKDMKQVVFNNKEAIIQTKVESSVFAPQAGKILETDKNSKTLKFVVNFEGVAYICTFKGISLNSNIKEKFNEGDFLGICENLSIKIIKKSALGEEDLNIEPLFPSLPMRMVSLKVSI